MEAHAHPHNAAPFATLKSAALWFEHWLKTDALPLWWLQGADHHRGGFHEALSLAAQPLDLPRRCRVPSRQTYVYAKAGLMGWQGPWRRAAMHAFSYLCDKYARPDGLFCALVSPFGEQLDASVAVYDQAFALLAMSALYEADVDRSDMLARAQRLLEALQPFRHTTGGGFRETGNQPFKSDPLMHLFEASLSWYRVAGGSEWRSLADELATLALTRLIDAKGGFIREYYDATWGPLKGEPRAEISPGHQFEWAWLINTWQSLGGQTITEAVRTLYQNGLKGMDPQRHVAMDCVDARFNPVTRSARMWPQTEFLRAALALDADSPEPALKAANALARYLDTPTVGLWRDLQSAEGVFLEGPAPASTLYHVIGAVSALTQHTAAHRAEGQIGERA